MRKFIVTFSVTLAVIAAIAAVVCGICYYLERKKIRFTELFSSKEEPETIEE